MTVDNLAMLLRAREEELSAIYENVPGIVFYVAVEPDGEFRFVSVSRDFLLATGLAREQIVGSLVREIIPPPSCDMVLNHYRQAIRSGQPVRWEEESVYPAGRRYGEVAVTPLYDAGGVATHIIGIVHDITERKQLEKERAEEERRKDEFLSLLGHELRNPLAAISTAMQSLSGGVSHEQRVALNGMMERQVKLMRRLLDDLLDLDRISRGYIQLKKEPIELTKFLQHVTEVTQSITAERGQEMVLQSPSEVVTFTADEARLEQIAINLLNNASKYTPQGGRIEFSGVREGSEVVLRCKDNGLGIPLEMQRKIFEPFIRIGPISESRGEASLGIGLALVRMLVELHGGTVSVESGGPGAGSEFLVRLPLEPALSDQPSPPQTNPTATLGPSLSIIVVEDNSDVAGTIVVALEQVGYRVTLFADAFSALAGISELMPNAILLDVGLPGIDGYELAAKLRKKWNCRHALFIGISGFKRRKTADDFDHYFTKPVNLSALLDLLDSISSQVGQANAATTGPAPEAARLRVLLVDDHADLSAAMADLLNREGFEVRTALSGEEGLKFASGFRPQLVLCDLNLPDMGGHEVVRRLRSNPATRSAYSVILTALSEAQIRDLNDGAKEVGVDEFIRKPLDREGVHSLVSRLKRRRISPEKRAVPQNAGHL
jgi:PAS domain S-box-containing protein